MTFAIKQVTKLELNLGPTQVFAKNKHKTLRVASPFFPGILLSGKPPNTLGKQLVFEKNDG